MAFQVTSPFDNRLALLPHALVLHVNPSTISESHTKKVERIQTRGGWVEQHWGDELTEISCDGGTGAFVNLYTGLSSIMRQKTIAWDRYRDLYDLYRNNGSIYDPFGAIVLQGKLLLIFDRGTFVGTFRSFDVEETAESPFAFKISWTFKVEVVLARVPGQYKLTPSPGLKREYVDTKRISPGFQGANAILGTPSAAASPTPTPVAGAGTGTAPAVASSVPTPTAPTPPPTTIVNVPANPPPTPATAADKAIAVSGAPQPVPQSPPVKISGGGGVIEFGDDSLIVPPPKK